MRELVLELALLGPSPGSSTLSCVALGKSWNLAGPVSSSGKRRVLDLLLSLLFGED